MTRRTAAFVLAACLLAAGAGAQAQEPRAPRQSRRDYLTSAGLSGDCARTAAAGSYLLCLGVVQGAALELSYLGRISLPRATSVSDWVFVVRDYLARHGAGASEPAEVGIYAALRDAYPPQPPPLRPRRLPRHGRPGSPHPR